MARILWVLVANLMWAALAGPASDPLPLPPSEPVRAAANQPADLIPRGYLPLVSGRAPSVNRVVNGDFEQGAVGWQQSSAYPGDLILDFVALALSPHGGQWAAWLGGENNEDSQLWQAVTLGAAPATLTFWYKIDSEDNVCGHDRGRVLISSAPVAEFDLCVSTNTGDWVQHTIGLSAYVGQTVELRFQADTDANLLSDFFVDDVAITP